MPVNSLQDAVAAALNSTDQTDVIEGIKGAVISEIERLDPSANITSTDYFNHSYAPDFVLSWGSKQDREVYLRYSLRSTQEARDVDLLGGTSPVFFSLDSRHDDAAVAEALENEFGQASGALVTNAPAIDGFTSGDAADTGSVAQPLLSLFRRNVVRGGRGVLVSGTATRLQSPLAGGGFEADLAYLNAFEETIPQIFRPEAATRLQRAAGIVRVARTGETTLFEHTDDPDEPQQRVIGGKLEIDELKILLPYLLERANAIDSVAFWRYVGGMFSLKELEQLSETIGSTALNQLAKANLDVWRAARATVTFSPEEFDAADGERVEPYWSVHSRMLAATAGAWRVHFAPNKRRGSTRDDSRLARWEDVLPALATFTVSSVDLQGTTRRVQLSAEDNSNVFGDVGAIHNTIGDDFRVRSLSVQPTDEESSNLEVDFKTMTADGTNALIGDLASAASRHPRTSTPADNRGTPAATRYSFSNYLFHAAVVYRDSTPPERRGPAHRTARQRRRVGPTLHEAGVTASLTPTCFRRNLIPSRRPSQATSYGSRHRPTNKSRAKPSDLGRSTSTDALSP
ncbi:hypothetical protein [Amycolatopsis sp. WGS_07]|uniref:hypothetical protein n=1 Tax=Amycolatopsis sp. WGS_07 TaxID=3076764 RepID=UPI0038733A0A